MPRPRALTAILTAGLLTVGLSATTAHADPAPTTLYVDGSVAACDNAGPGSEAVPFCAAQAAADVVDPGQTVVVRNTANSQPVVITRSGTAEAPITFSGVFTHTGTLSADSTVLTVKNAQYINLDDVRVQAFSGAGAVSLVNARHVNLSRSSVRTTSSGTTDALDIDGGSSDVNVSACWCLSFNGTAIKVAAGASHLTVASSRLEVEQGNGTGLGVDGTTDLRVAGDTVDTQNGTGVSITGSSSGSVENTVVSPRAHTQLTVAAESVATVTADYNAVTADQSSNTYYTAYNWGGTRYTSSADFYAATGQGRHDVDTLVDEGFSVAEGSPVIDSGDANAPGESATDYLGRPRVDDPTVPNSGTGSGTTDRGASEFQNPFSVSAVSMAPSQGPAPLPVTVTAAVQNLWSTPVTGYTFDFGDGTPPQDSAELSVDHTFQNPVAPAGGSYSVTVTAHRADGVSSKGTGTIQVGSPGPLVPQLAFQVMSGEPDSVWAIPSATSPWAVTGHTVNYGDGSPVVHVDGVGRQLLPLHTFPAPGTYTVTDTATDAGGRTATGSKQITVGTAFVPLATPQRILDTRNGTGGHKAKIGPGGIVKIKVAGAATVPGKGVAAVTMNVTPTNASADSWIVAYPDGSPRPVASNLNFRAGQTNPNLVTVPVGKDGYVDLWNGKGSVDLVADIQGYFTTAVNYGTSNTYFLPVSPTRIVDTRNGLGGRKVPLGPGQCLSHQFNDTTPSSGAAPSAAVLSVTATGADSAGLITVYPVGVTEPNTSNLNFQAGQTTSNLVVVPTGFSGANQTALFCNHTGHVNLLVDLQGYYFNGMQPATGYLPLSPTRLVDTRNGTGAPKHRLGARTALRIKVTGTHGIPAGATAAVINLTGVAPSTSTWLNTYGSGKTPTTSDLNLLAGQTRPVLTSVPIDSSGYITVYNAYGTVDVVADLEGYYAPVA